MVRVTLPVRRGAALPAALAALSVFITPTEAQNTNTNNNNNDEDEDEEPTPSPDDDDADETANNDDAEETGNNDDDDDSTPSDDADDAEETGNNDDNDEDEDNVVITGGESAAEITPSPSADDDDDDDDDNVAITGGDAGTGTAETDFPSLTNAPLIATYPPAAVPPTINAPFMRHSSAPEGTVFIVVGAILGAFGLGILLWRGIVACLLHRSVRRAAQDQHALPSDKGTSFPAPPAQFYKYSDHASNPSLGNLSASAGGAAAGRGQRRTNRGPIPSATPSQSNLFFSPTAAGGGGTASSRDSRFLPSGFYAAGNSSPGGGANPSPHHAHSISLTNLRPESRGLSKGGMREATPPESPHFMPRRDLSTSTLNLASPPQQNRAPSAYLEDLLDENPEAFPPSHMPQANPQRSPPATRH